MNQFKINHEKKIKLGHRWYKPYTVGELPPSFGRLPVYDEETETTTSGIYQWFNYKGLTYILEQ